MATINPAIDPTTAELVVNGNATGRQARAPRADVETGLA